MTNNNYRSNTSPLIKNEGNPTPTPNSSMLGKSIQDKVGKDNNPQNDNKSIISTNGDQTNAQNQISTPVKGRDSVKVQEGRFENEGNNPELNKTPIPEGHNDNFQNFSDKQKENGKFMEAKQNSSNKNKK